MKKNWLLILFVALMSAGVFAVMQFGIQPRVVAEIDLSGFDSVSDFDMVTIKKLDTVLRDQPILFLGYQPEKKNQRDLVTEMVQLLQNSELKRQNLFVEKFLDLQIPNFIAVDTQAEWRVLADKIKTSVLHGESVLVVVPAIFSSHLVKNNVVDLVQKAISMPVLSITAAELLRNREEESSAIFRCIVVGDVTGTGDLGCAIMQSSRTNYRKKIPPHAWIGLVEQHRENDYLILLSNR